MLMSVFGGTTRLYRRFIYVILRSSGEQMPCLQRTVDTTPGRARTRMKGSSHGGAVLEDVRRLSSLGRFGPWVRRRSANLTWQRGESAAAAATPSNFVIRGHCLQRKAVCSSIANFKWIVLSILF